ncbi:hypothetical protein A3A09_03250 [Candidatus Nomurabacteria bacterium RIFCSPLOWO2_01_FULL_42_20]|uniref:Uncharacterized protein n=1 Tax=Candidatus Nomurabacteria bacterium RIFCSPHIGHO2_01_FULL_42_16 TaxID=1801743 RepID=A0A1F6VLZ2_9BACT|nr:MAG: hypothetical protein A2824_00300 [Candidatus Nomurabacteria bacterium RIFCSPHIGHO2_01_FULL_42_16]OGI91280.1 MAG: hypothetical protein A3A09_03250 [Candidatus Nomurabacteria bacterium RIFCSPLOWO2_01_FULL_42_20]
MPFPDIESGNGNAHYECAHANVLSGENSFFWGVSQRDGARGSALPAGRDSDPKKKEFSPDRMARQCLTGVLNCAHAN